MSSVSFRADVEGLRAVAVLLVVAFHARLMGFGGGFVGVDVFYVISGFLITGLLVEEWSRTGTVSLTHFYARRARRLLPLSTVVLLAIAVTAALVVPAIDRPAIGSDIRAAALWFANWHFAGSATQYMADVDQSPVLHYWSLSVEEQFYVIWPLLILAVVHLFGGRRRTREQLRWRLLGALIVLGAFSFTLSVLTTGTQGPWAYFGLQTRAWELAAGGSLALAAPLLPRLTTRGGSIAGLVGFAGIGVAALGFDRATPFPGWVALIPVAGTLLLLVAGSVPTSSAARLLSTAPMTYIGRRSYGWYLWHWPCLVFAGLLWGKAVDDAGISGPSHTGPGFVPLVGAVLLSFALAVVSHSLVEQPVRRSAHLAKSVTKSLVVGATLVSTALVSPVLAREVTGAPDANHQVIAEAGYPALTMTPAAARKQFNSIPGCFIQFTQTSVGSPCRFGAPNGRKVVVLLGDSHAAHWFPTMETLARSQGWQLYFWSKAACAVADVPIFTTAYNREYTECATWRRAVLARIAALPRVDAVVIGRSYGYLPLVMDGKQRVTDAEQAQALWGQGMARTLTSLAGSTDHVVVLRETPRPGRDVPTCLSEYASAPDTCSFPGKGHFRLDEALYESERDAAPEGVDVHFVDMTAAVCPRDPCRVVSDRGTVVFRDRHHLTVTYAKEIAPALLRALSPYL